MVEKHCSQIYGWQLGECAEMGKGYKIPVYSFSGGTEVTTMFKTIDMTGKARVFRITLNDENGVFLQQRISPQHGAIGCWENNPESLGSNERDGKEGSGCVLANSKEKMTKEELAGNLNGNQYRNEISEELEAEAKKNGLVVVFGASDDLMEFRGAIHDEQGACDGTTALIDSEGLLPKREQIDNDDELERFFQRRKIAKEIQVLWCERPGYLWTYETDIPHSTFDIIEENEIAEDTEDDEEYCRGIVFSLADVGVGDIEKNKDDMCKKILAWFATGSVGESSKAMACAVAGLPNNRSHPYDPADFNRCLLLLDAVPEIKKHMDKVAAISETWGKLVARWGEVEQCFLGEAGRNWSCRKAAPQTYQLMKDVGC